MKVNPAIERIVGWLRTSYPAGVPDTDYQPLLALMRRRLTEDEVRELGHELVAGGLVPADRVDVGVGITKVTQELPTIEELDRVTRHLRRFGFPVDTDTPWDPPVQH